jgi:hypothetical protein
VSGSWKLSNTRKHGAGNAEKRSRKKLRTNRARSCWGSELKRGKAIALCRPVAPRACAGSEERRAVGIPGVVLVPEVTQAPRLDIARDERGLAGTRRGGYPDDRPLRGFVQKREETRPRKRFVQLGPGQFGERRAGCQVASSEAGIPRQA